jgi:hypothetical protein
MNPRISSVVVFLSVALMAACAERLATLPPSDTYLVSEPGTPKLDGDQQEYVDKVNAELAKYGIAPAVPGKYETDAAALMANIELSKIWHGSSHGVADTAVTPGAKPGGMMLDGGGYAPLYPASDEPDSNDPKTIHWDQQLMARGVPRDFGFDVTKTSFPRSQLNADEIETAVNGARPHLLVGRLRIGVARLAEKGDGTVIFALVLRDERAFFTTTPPRKAAPGAGFDIAGQIVDKTLAKMQLGLLKPDGHVQIQDVDTREDGTFSAHMDLPSQPGVYVVTLAGPGYRYAVFNAPIFVGVDPTPWPATADPSAPPIDGPRALAKQLAGDVNAWRHSHGFPVLDVDAKLSAIAHAEAGRTAQALAKVRTKKPVTREQVDQLERMSREAEKELTAAGFDPALVRHYYEVHTDDTVSDWLARLPWDAIAANTLGSPDAQHLAVGVVMAPKNDIDDAFSALYVIDWFMAMRAAPPAPPVVPPPAEATQDAGATPPAAPAAAPEASAPPAAAAAPSATPETPAATPAPVAPPSATAK